MKKPKNRKKHSNADNAEVEVVVVAQEPKSDEPPKKPEIDWSAFRAELINEAPPPAAPAVEEPPKTEPSKKSKKKVKPYLSTNPQLLNSLYCNNLSKISSQQHTNF